MCTNEVNVAACYLPYAQGLLLNTMQNSYELICIKLLVDF